MSLAIIDGSNATIDVSLNTVSYKCMASYWSADISRDMLNITTFCSGGWRARRPGQNVLTGRIVGFATTGFAGSDPLALFASGFQASGVPFVLTATSGCYLSGTCNVTNDHIGMRAALESEAGTDFESTGPVTSVWIVS
jgi:hypothetical protein